ncbi:hypothetical protein ACFL1W_00075 [Candidatus Margulisiibacteriota bacterium]
MIAAGLISFLAGLVLLLTPRLFSRFCIFCDRIVFTIDDKMIAYRNSSSIVLIMIAVWFFFMAISYPGVARLLHPLWILLLFLGLLYLFFPDWLRRLINISDRSVFPTDQFVMGACRVAGIFLVVASVYIFYGAFMLWTR